MTSGVGGGGGGGSGGPDPHRDLRDPCDHGYRD